MSFRTIRVRYSPWAVILLFWVFAQPVFFGVCGRGFACGLGGGAVWVGAGCLDTLGTGVEPVASESLELDRLRAQVRIVEVAAQLGARWAESMMGMVYHGGEMGFPRDAARAFSYFRSAASKGDSLAQYYVGLYHMEGLGGARLDWQEARCWFEESARGGYVVSMCVLGGRCAVDGDWACALRWFERAASLGFSGAEVALADLYYQDGDGVSNDYVCAAELYSRAASRGELRAKFMLGLLYWRGHGVSQNWGRAFSLLRESADGGYTESFRWLSRAYAEGRGVWVDWDLSRRYGLEYRLRREADDARVLQRLDGLLGVGAALGGEGVVSHVE